MPLGPECIHDLRTKAEESSCVYVTKVIIALHRGRVMLPIHLAPVVCVQQKVLQDGHREVIVIQVDLAEPGAPAEGRCEDSELRVLHPTTLQVQGLQSMCHSL